MSQHVKNITDYGDKLDAEAKNKLEGAVSRLKEASQTENLDEIKSATEGLNQVWNEVSANLYQQPGAPGAPGAEATAENAAPGSGAPTGENVEEADFEVVDEENKDK